MQITIKKIVLVIGRGPDLLSIHSDLPDEMDMKVAANAGEEYCARYFPGVPVDIVRCLKSDYKFLGG